MPEARHKPPKPTPAELELLRVLWSLGQSTVKDVHRVRQDERPDVTYATVLRLMQVMHGKGLLLRDESQRSHVYSAVQKPETLSTGLLGDLIQRAFAGSGKDLVMAALKGHVSPEEREEIRRYLRESGDE